MWENKMKQKSSWIIIRSRRRSPFSLRFDLDYSIIWRRVVDTLWINITVSSVMREINTSVSRILNIEWDGVIVWSLGLVFDRIFVFVEEGEGEMRRIRLIIGEPSEVWFFWGVIGLSKRGWKFISLMIAKANAISI